MESSVGKTANQADNPFLRALMLDSAADRGLVGDALRIEQVTVEYHFGWLELGVFWPTLFVKEGDKMLRGTDHVVSLQRF
jgi:hypothetical protein